MEYRPALRVSRIETSTFAQEQFDDFKMTTLGRQHERRTSLDFDYLSAKFDRVLFTDCIHVATTVDECPHGIDVALFGCIVNLSTECSERPQSGDYHGDCCHTDTTMFAIAVFMFVSPFFA